MVARLSLLKGLISSESVSFVECFGCEEVPNRLEDVENSEARDERFAAMMKVFDSLVEKKTWELCDLPDHKKALDGRWVFALKKDENGQVIKYKARKTVSQKGSSKFLVVTIRKLLLLQLSYLQ